MHVLLHATFVIFPTSISFILYCPVCVVLLTNLSYFLLDVWVYDTFDNLLLSFACIALISNLFLYLIFFAFALPL